MSNAFVWFHNGSEKPNEVAKFYETLLGWKPAGGPPGTTMFAGETGPFAGVGPLEGKSRRVDSVRGGERRRRRHQAGREARCRHDQGADPRPSRRLRHRPGSGRRVGGVVAKGIDGLAGPNRGTLRR